MTRRLVMGLTLATLMSTAACIDPIDLDVGDPVAMLVVDGQVAEGGGPHTVILSRTGSFTQGISALRPRETGALVVVEVGDGSEVVLPEVAGGRYVAGQGELIGEVGQTYALRVVLRDGTEYRSPAIEMLSATDILAVKADLVEGSRSVNGVVIPDPRIELSVDAEVYPDRPTYYRWRWRAVHSHLACYPLHGLEHCEPCFRETESPSLLEVADDALASNNVLHDHVIDILPTEEEGYRFVPASYFVIEQQSLTPEAFGFWSLIRDMRESVGSLFDPPAEATNGNMANVDDPSDRALGYFTVAGTSTADICVRRDDFADFPAVPGIEPTMGQCGVDVPGTTEMPPAMQVACSRE